MTAAAPMPGLHGREAETGALNRALDQAASGRLAVVLAEGEAGIGTTRLLAETLTTARGRGMRVAAGRGGELESARPFGVIAEALQCARASADPRRSAIAALLSTPGSDGSPITVARSLPPR
jgi:predicted ATPase